VNLRIAHLSDVGRVRTGNEDSVLCVADTGTGRGHLLIVADGMGGALAGERASRMAVDCVAEVYLGGSNGPAMALRQAMREANERIHKTAQLELDARGMGTTCTAAVAVGNHLWLASVGDTRAYRLRQGLLLRLTRDHSVWAERIQNDEFAATPSLPAGRNELTRAVGVEPRIEPELYESEIQPGDRLCLCTDGLWVFVTDPEIAQFVGILPPEEACRQLVALANARGGHDNISVVVAEVEG
jgi:serine/threonine protein phosphatase PrpC